MTRMPDIFVDSISKQPTRVNTLIQAFSSVAAGAPGATAVVDASERLTYRDLAERAGTVSATLQAEGIAPGQLVAVRMSPRADMVAVILGILGAGVAYLPLNNSGDSAREYFIASDAQPAAIFEDVKPGSAAASPATPGYALRMFPHKSTAVVPVNTAYVIYTSGTTGHPKGVPVSHENVLALFTATSPVFDFTGDDIWLLYHSITFDFSVWETWGAFLYGGCLVVPGHYTVRDPDDCAELIQRERVTVLNQTPTAFGVLSPALISTGRHDLRHVIFGGECLRPATLTSWVNVHGLARPLLSNMYGITETTVHATFHRVTQADIMAESSVIGRLLPGFIGEIADDQGLRASSGELLLAGPQVCSGYLNRARLTSERFVRRGGRVFYHTGDIVSRDDSGALTYLGRTDDQVKIRGYRIELGEVEAALMRISEVSGAIATRFALAGAESLGCVYTTRGMRVQPVTIKNRLRLLLPDYMIPAKLLWLRELPKTKHGKADRSAVRSILEKLQNEACQ
jgi:amino acid adenylation domain-containing protein